MLRVGMTYDLRTDYLEEGYSEEQTAEFDQPATIDAIEETLGSLGYRTDRIGHVRALAKRLVAGDRWDLVFNIAEGLKGFGRESQVPCLLDAYDIPYVFSDPLVLSLTLHKAMAKRVVRDLGIPTPDFAVVEDTVDIAAVSLPYPLFVKPLSEGTGKGINEKSIVRDAGELDARCRSLLEAFSQPVLVETYLSGREFTVGIVGTGRKARTIAVMEVILRENAEKGVYSLVNKEYCEQFVDYALVTGWRRPSGCRRSPWLHGEDSSAGTGAGSTSGPMPPGCRIFWRSIPWRVFIRPIPIFPSCPPSQACPIEIFSE